MKGKCVLIWCICVFMWTIVGCQKTPDTKVQDGVLTVKDSIYIPESSRDENADQTIPELVETEFISDDCRLNLDADILFPDVNVTKGSVRLSEEPEETKVAEVLFKNRPIDLLDSNGTERTWGLAGQDIFSPNSVLFRIESYLNNLKQYTFNDNSIAQYFSIEAKAVPLDNCTEKQMELIQSCADMAEEYLDQMDIHQVINNAIYYESDHPYVYFETVNEMDGIKCCTSNVLGGKPEINCSGYMEISDQGLSHFAIFADFSIDEAESCVLMDWDGILKNLEFLTQRQKLRRIDETIPITHIELKYLIKEEQGIYSYYPVWSFEAYSDVFFRVLPVFAINAETGALEFVNSDY